MKIVDPTALGSVAQQLQKRIDDGHVPGGSAAVWLRGRKVYETHLGWFDQAAGIPMREDAIYHMASMTKPVTAVALMQQVELGRVALTDEVRKYIPELTGFRVAERDEKGEITGYHPAPREITLLDCLTHSSGLGSGGVSGKTFEQVRMKPGETFRDFVPRYIQMDLAFDPGTEQLYSGIAAPDVVAAVVEKVSGEDYADYLKNHVTGPLGMKDTAYEITAEQRARVAVPGAWDPESGTCKPAEIRPSEFFGDNPVGISGGGCLYSTLADYGRFAQMLLGEGEFDGVRILSAESVREIAKPRLPDTIRGINRHFNWGLLVRVLPNTHSERQPLPAGTFGWSGAFGTHFIIVPEWDLCGVILTNTTTAGGAGAITAKEFETAIISAVREV